MATLSTKITPNRAMDFAGAIKGPNFNVTPG